MLDHAPKPRTVLIANAQYGPVGEALARLRPLVDEHLDVVLCQSDENGDLEHVEAELAIVIGGDGSMLRAARQMGYEQMPVLGINLGKLGFLADVTEERFVEVLPLLARGEFRVLEHLMFECELLRLNGDGSSRPFHSVLGLNEVAVLSGMPFHILDIELRVDGESATTYSCDGLIVSTPVGSTAHNLSAGGPILRKELDAFVISPISAHTLTVRPVVDSADRVYELSVSRPNRGSAVVVDGQVIASFEPGDIVRVRRAAPRFKMIEIPGHNYYHTLHEKLGWGGRLRMKE